MTLNTRTTAGLEVCVLQRWNLLLKHSRPTYSLYYAISSDLLTFDCVTRHVPVMHCGNMAPAAWRSVSNEYWPRHRTLHYVTVLALSLRHYVSVVIRINDVMWRHARNALVSPVMHSASSHLKPPHTECRNPAIKTCSAVRLRLPPEVRVVSCFKIQWVFLSFAETAVFNSVLNHSSVLNWCWCELFWNRNLGYGLSFGLKF